MASALGFKSQHQSSSAAPFPTPPTIGHSCQHSCIFPALLGCHIKPGQLWPCDVGPIISKLLHRLCNQGELPPSYNMGWSHSHPPGLKHGHSCFTYLWNQLKVIDMLNHCSRDCLQNLLFKTTLNSPAPCVPSPSSDLGEDILYIYFLIFPGHPDFWTSLKIPICSPRLGCTLLQLCSCSSLLHSFFVCLFV